MKYIGSTVCLSAGLLPLLAGVATAANWDMPTGYPAQNFHTLNAQEFGKCVAAATKGEVNIVVHPNGSLFKGNDIKRAVQTGQAQIGERLLSAHENENAVFGFDSIPFLATSYEDSAKLYSAARPELAKLLAEQGLELLYSVPWPPQGIYFNKEVNSITDMGGVKVRSYNNATARLAELTGMAPQQIEAAEISQALATGVINSLITSAVTGQDSKVWEQLNHFYEVRAWMPRNTVIANKATWDALSKDAQSGISACAAKAEEAGLKMSQESNGSALKTLASNGMKVMSPSEALTADLKKIGETMTNEWIAKSGEAGSNIISGFKK